MFMKNFKIFFCSVVLLLIIVVIPSFAASPSNIGLTGLWEYPTADMPGDGMGRISYSDFYPYRSGAVSFGLFPWLEMNIRLTEFETAAIISPGYGRYKDKAMDLKFLLMDQKGPRPAVAVGVLDMMGTEKRKAYFTAGTWRHKELSVTLGYATDAYNGFFGGISWEPAEWLEFKAEYSPLDYTRDIAGGKKIHPDPAKEKYNLGIVLKSEWGLNGSLSWQRGEEFCFGLSYAFDLSKPVFGGKNKAETPEPLLTDWNETDLEKMASELQSELGKKGFGLRNTVVLAGDKKVHVAYENIGYSSQAEAAARAIILTAHMIPWDTEICSISSMVRGTPVSRIELNTEKMALIRLHKLNAYDLEEKAVKWAPKTRYGTLPGEEWKMMAGPGESIRNGSADIRIALAYEPRIDRTIDNIYMGRLDIDYIGRLRSSEGWEAYLKVRQPITNDIDIPWQPEISDMTRIWKGVLSYIHKLDERAWVLGEIGWLDENYFGGNFWGRYFLEDSPFWIGGRVSVIKERDFDSFAGLADYQRSYDSNSKAYYSPTNGENDWRTGFWAEVGYHDTTYNADIIARFGQFIDSDKGYRIDAIRNWNHASVGVYFTDTDRKAWGNKSFTDAGMILHIPLSFWYAGRPSNTYWDQEFTVLSQFRLLAGTIPGAWMTPESLIGELNPRRLNQELGPLMEKLMRDVRDDGQPEVSRKSVYGLMEYLSGEFRVQEAIGEEAAGVAEQ